MVDGIYQISYHYEVLNHNSLDIQPIA